MLGANDLRNGTVFTYESAPWKVLNYHQHFQGRGRGKVQIRAKNLLNGAVRELSFQSTENFEEADLERRKVTFLYRTREDAVFDDQDEELLLPLSQIEWEIGFCTKGLSVWVLFYEGKPIGVTLPPVVTLRVKSTDPGVKGDTVSNTLKPATFSSGFTTKVPLFIDEGEEVVVSTETGEYRGRATS